LPGTGGYAGGGGDVSSVVDVKLAMGAADALDAIWRRYRDAVE